MLPLLAPEQKERKQGFEGGNGGLRPPYPLPATEEKECKQGFEGGNGGLRPPYPLPATEDKERKQGFEGGAAPSQQGFEGGTAPSSWRRWLLRQEVAGETEMDVSPEEPMVSIVSRKSLNPDHAIRLLIRGLASKQIKDVVYNLQCQVPTMAIAVELVHVIDNDGVIQSDILAESLRLTAIHADARFFDDLPKTATTYNGRNAIEFELKCDFDSDLELVEKAKKRNPKTDPAVVKYVYANDLRVVSKHPQHPFEIRPAEPNKQLAVLTLHQSLHLRCLAIKGRGSEHSAWMPVAQEGHVLRPTVDVTRPVTGIEAKRLISVCPQRVFKRAPKGAVSSHSSPLPASSPLSPPVAIEDCAIVGDSSKCLGMAVCTRCTSAFLPFADAIQLGFKKDEFLLRVESVNKIPSIQLWNQAVELTFGGDKDARLSTPTQSTETSFGSLASLLSKLKTSTR